MKVRLLVVPWNMRYSRASRCLVAAGRTGQGGETMSSTRSLLAGSLCGGTRRARPESSSCTRAFFSPGPRAAACFRESVPSRPLMSSLRTLTPMSRVSGTSWEMASPTVRHWRLATASRMRTSPGLRMGTTSRGKAISRSLTPCGASTSRARTIPGLKGPLPRGTATLRPSFQKFSGKAFGRE